MNKINFKFGIILALAILAGLCRLVPHVVNFTPTIAMTLFGVAYGKNKSQAFLIGVLGLFLSDLYLNTFIHNNLGFSELWSACLINYTIIGLVVLATSTLLKKVNFQNVLVSGILASVIFFAVSNLASFFMLPQFYTRDFAGLTTCFVAALPFFKASFLGDLFYSSILFGLYELVKVRVFQLEEVKA